MDSKIITGHLIVNTQSYKHINTYDVYIPSCGVCIECAVDKSTKKDFYLSCKVYPTSVDPKRCIKILSIPKKLVKLSKLEKLYGFLDTQITFYLDDEKK